MIEKVKTYEELADLMATRCALNKVMAMHNASLDAHTLPARGPLLAAFNLSYTDIYEQMMLEHSQPMRKEEDA